MDSIRAYWHVCENFGDTLTPYLIRKISGLDAVFADVNSTPAPFMVTGSILGCNVYRGIVWGSGSAFSSDLNPEFFSAPTEEFKIMAIRGKLSKKLVEASGHEPLAVGDPGILLPRFYTSTAPKKYKFGIMCSWVDYDQVVEQYSDPDVSIINSMGEVENIIDRMFECETLATSTLHGFITAITYRIPSVLVKFSDKMIGDDFKYKDFYSCLDSAFEMVDLRNKTTSITELISLTNTHNLCVNENDLLKACPFGHIKNDSSI